jgi:hypothetical protein
MKSQKSTIEQKNCVFKMMSAQYVSSLDKLLISLDQKDKYPIEITFSVKYVNKQIAIMMSCWINRKADIPGYVIHTETFSFFDTPPNENDPSIEENAYYEIECLELAIQRVRERIFEVTENFPIGAYKVPNINIDELYHSKSFDQTDKPLWN